MREREREGIRLWLAVMGIVARFMLVVIAIMISALGKYKEWALIILAIPVAIAGFVAILYGIILASIEDQKKEQY